MRFKYYLRGCGLGILLATIIFAIGYHRSGGGMTDEKVMQRASELGMIMPDATDSEARMENDGAADTQKSSGEKSSEEAGLGKDTSEKEDSEEKSSEKTGSGKDTSEKEDSERNQSGREDSEKDKKVKVVVRRGEVCRELAEELFEKGLVPDAEEFRLFMQENGYDDLIRVGEFILTAGMSPEEIAEILITNPE